jgi:hypothetical protein
MKNLKWLQRLLSRYRNWRWMRRNLALGAGTRRAMDIGNKIAAKNPPSPALIRAIRMSIENERRLRG